jgi:hypothetical protein
VKTVLQMCEVRKLLAVMSSIEFMVVCFQSVAGQQAVHRSILVGTASTATKANYPTTFSAPIKPPHQPPTTALNCKKGGCPTPPPFIPLVCFCSFQFLRAINPQVKSDSRRRGTASLLVAQILDFFFKIISQSGAGQLDPVDRP